MLLVAVDAADTATVSVADAATVAALCSNYNNKKLMLLLIYMFHYEENDFVVGW